jgi:hypothetical protein
MSDLEQNGELPIEEASAQKMPVGTEADSIASVDKTDDAVKKAPSRKGDTGKQDPMPKTKAGMLNAMYSKMQEDYEDVEEGEAVELPEFSYNDELKDLVESEATLSDEFKVKTAVIFETAIRTKLSEEIDRLEDEYQTRLGEELEATRSDLVEKVDSYLNYVVESWTKENQLAIETGLRTEIAEDFMGKLKDLFLESYIEVPDSKVDLVDELAEQVEELEEKLNLQTSEVLNMAEEIESYQRESVVREATRDLAETQVEKLRSLVSSLDFEDQESFAQKVKTVKESYFKKAVTVEDELIEDWDNSTQPQAVNSVMDMYLNAIKKSNK